MTDRPLTEELQETFAAVDALQRRHQDALVFAASAAHLAFLQGQADALNAAIVQARAAAESLTAVSEGWWADRIGAQLAAIRDGAPADWRSPGRAIAGEGLDLLRLVDYTAASRGQLMVLTQQMNDRLLARDEPAAPR